MDSNLLITGYNVCWPDFTVHEQPWHQPLVNTGVGHCASCVVSGSPVTLLSHLVMVVVVLSPFSAAPLCLSVDCQLHVDTYPIKAWVTSMSWPLQYAVLPLVTRARVQDSSSYKLC